MSNFTSANKKSWSAPSIEELPVDLSSVAGFPGPNCQTDTPRYVSFGGSGACPS